jgi:hypothetical protein
MHRPDGTLTSHSESLERILGLVFNDMRRNELAPVVDDEGVGAIVGGFVGAVHGDA